MKLADAFAKCSFEIKSPSQPFDVPKDQIMRYNFFSFALRMFGVFFTRTFGLHKISYSELSLSNFILEIIFFSPIEVSFS